MQTKQELRKQSKEIRKKLDIKSISKILVQKIRNLQEYKSAQNVMIFYPLKYEIDLLELVNDNKNFYLPKVKDDNLVVCPYCDDLEKSDLNIFEPCSTPCNPEILDLIFTPALMADKEGYRLGYGKGYYDRFLKQYPNIKTILPIPKDLVADELPKDDFDVKVWKVIC